MSQKIVKRLERQMVQFMDPKYFKKTMCEALSTDEHGIEHMIEERLMFTEPKNLSDDLLKDLVKTWTKLAKKYEVGEDTVNQFYKMCIDLSYYKNTIEKTISKEKDKMEKQMKKIWGAQSNGTKEKVHYAGNAPEETQSTTTESEEMEEVVTEKHYKKLYPKLARELCEKGIKKVTTDTKPSDATIEELEDCGIEYEYPDMDEVEELMEEQVHCATEDVCETEEHDVVDSTGSDSEYNEDVIEQSVYVADTVDDDIVIDVSEPSEVIEIKVEKEEIVLFEDEDEGEDVEIDASDYAEVFDDNIRTETIKSEEQEECTTAQEEKIEEDDFELNMDIPTPQDTFDDNRDWIPDAEKNTLFDNDDEVTIKW